MRETTCCFTGHRNISLDKLAALSAELERLLRQLISGGIQDFCAGGALGFDTLAAETVLRLKKEYPCVRLILILPCRDQTKRWRSEDIAKYEEIRSKADEVIYTGEVYAPGCMHRRNRYLVDYSAVCVAYCIREKGGSAYTVDYARRQGLRILNLGENPQTM